MSPADSYSIGVVSYVRRFEQYFKPLVLQLEAMFPDVDKCFVLNGYPDAEVQASYVDQATAFVVDNCRRYCTISFSEHQGLARCWNLAVRTRSTRNALLLNDDLVLAPGFRECIEEQFSCRDLFILNGWWSAFGVSRALIEEVGWFDENFQGIGHEDLDFGLRMALARRHDSYDFIWSHDVHCPYVRNLTPPNDDPGWRDISANAQGRYARCNEEYFWAKWQECSAPGPERVRLHDKYLELRRRPSCA